VVEYLRVFVHVGFFRSWSFDERYSHMKGCKTCEVL